MPSQTQIVFRADGASLGVHGALVIAVTEGARSFHPANVRRVVDEIARLRRTTHADRLVYVYVAGERTELPGAESREIASRLGELIDVCVGVHEGTGFRASAVRAVVTGIAMLSRARVRPEIVATVDEAARAVRARGADLGAEHEIAAAIEAVRDGARAA